MAKAAAVAVQTVGDYLQHAGRREGTLQAITIVLYDTGTFNACASVLRQQYPSLQP